MYLKSVFISLFAICSIQAKEAALLSPLQVTKQLQEAIPKVMPGTVAVSIGGYASGVIISPDGLVLSAAHAVKRMKKEQTATITLSDGTEAKAERLGYNEETDYAVLKITSPKRDDWPHCKLAKTAPTTGAFCFTLAHPSGRLKGRAAQARLGRIYSHSISRGRPLILFSDCNIQPGDSGGPLFSLKGELIGLDSSAATILGMNLFPAIDQYHLDKKRLLNKEHWGDPNKGPTSPLIKEATLDNKTLETLQAEFMRRFKMQYPPTVDYVQSLNSGDNNVSLTQQNIVNHMTREALAVSKKQPLGFGLDDPALAKQLPDLPKTADSQVAVYSNKKRLCSGMAVGKHHILTKASLVEGAPDLRILIGKKLISAKVVATDDVWDLAVIELKKDYQLPVIMWPKNQVPVIAGELLIAADAKSRKIWNIATGEAGPAKSKRSIGPLADKTLISQHRAPYPEVIRHALPLFAKDAGTLVFNKDGVFIGMHIARFSRTMGFVIPAKKLQMRAKKMLKSIKG